MKVIVTICSEKKDNSPKLLRAYKRYTSSRINKVKVIADESKLPFMIFSGKYGLIDSDSKIHYYDHLLGEDEIVKMSKVVLGQAQKLGVTSIFFYAESKDSWLNYYSVIEDVTKRLKINLVVVPV